MTTDPAVAVNVADVAATGTVTDDGTGSAVVLLDDSATAIPPDDAGCVSVIVQVVWIPDITLAGEQASVWTVGMGVTVTVAVVLPASVAVTVTVCNVVTGPAVAGNVVDVAFAGTVTDVCTGNAAALLDESATVLPPAGAGWFKLAVHVVDVPDTKVAGAQVSDDTLTIGVTLTVAVVLPPRAAVTTTACGVATEPAVAVNVADVAAAGTVTEAGTGRAVALLDESVTVLPAASAG